MARRMAVYAALLAGRRPFGRPVRRLEQVVVQLLGPPMAVGLNLGGLLTAPMLLHVPSTDAHDLLAVPGLAPLALGAHRDGGVGDLVPEVLSAVRLIDGTAERSSAVTVALQLAPQVADTVLSELRRAGMQDVMAVLRTTEWGRGLMQEGRVEGRVEGREEGLREAVTLLLAQRFPAAARSDVEGTVARLVAEHGDAAVAVALDVHALDA